MMKRTHGEVNMITPEELLGGLNDVERKYAPKELFFEGDIDLVRNTRRVAIVGARKATEAGLARARKLAALLVERDVVVVSGLAEGIDTAAHTAAMAKGGRTVAVIGTPLSRAYPKENEGLQDEIKRNHLCVSQFEIGKNVHRANFPMRNRTMALLSHATVIIEASDSSGSWSQGWEALRLGRDLYIAKSVVDNPALTVPDKLLFHGASVLTDDVLEDLIEQLPEQGSNEEITIPF